MQPALQLALGVVFGFLGYRESEKFKSDNGVTPWRMPSLVWAVICFASLLIGAVLLYFARKNTKPEPPTPTI